MTPRLGISVLSLGWMVLCACSSSDTSPPAPVDDSHKCTEAGGVCAKNSPFLCAPGYEAAVGALTSVCGRLDPPPGSEAPSIPFPCCLPIPEDAAPDTRDASADASDASDGGADAADALDAPDAPDAMDTPADVDGGG